MLWKIEGWDKHGWCHNTDVEMFLVESVVQPTPEECEQVAKREGFVIPGISYNWTIENYEPIYYKIKEDSND